MDYYERIKDARESDLMGWLLASSQQVRFWDKEKEKRILKDDESLYVESERRNIRIIEQVMQERGIHIPGGSTAPKPPRKLPG